MILPMTTKKFPTLYGVSSKGVTKVWDIQVSQYAKDAVITVSHGQLGGKIQHSPETIREGMNIGKSNETSPYEQACLEAQSKWSKKHDSNYTEHLPKIDAGMGKYVTFGEDEENKPARAEEWAKVLLDMIDHLDDYKKEAATFPERCLGIADVDQNVATLEKSYLDIIKEH